VSDPLIIPKTELREKQGKPRRAEYYVIPPDSMLELSDEDRAWVKAEAPNVPDADRATKKWHMKHQTNRGCGKPLAEWKISWQLYMMNYSDGEVSRNGRNGNNGNGKQQSQYETASERNVRNIVESAKFFGVDVQEGGLRSNNEVAPRQITSGAHSGRNGNGG
jgi:hypothetical protein